MVSKINADTSDGLKITSDTSGTLDIQSAGTTKMTIGSTIDCQGNELVLDADADTSIHASVDDRVDLKIGGTDQVQFFGSGQILLGKTTNSFTTAGGCYNDTGSKNGSLELISDGGVAIALNRLSSTGSTMTFHQDSTGVGSIGVTGSATSFNTSSDYRLKENVDYTFDATTRLKQLKPCRFNWIADNTDTALDGFLAHEVSTVVPEAITGEKDAEEMQQIDQSKLVPLLVKTIQELEARITALES